MTSVKRTYTLTPTKQLVDLNNDSVNFDITFTVTSLTKTPFYVVVVNQTILDNSEEYDFQYAKEGSLSGQIVFDNNEYQNHFLVLKSDETNNVEVEIVKKELPITPGIPQLQDTNTVIPPSHVVKQKGSYFSWFAIIGLFVLGGFAVYYYYYKPNNQSDKEETPSNSLSKSPAISVTKNVFPEIETSQHSSPANSDFSFSSKSSTHSSTFGHKLTNRLRRLEI